MVISDKQHQANRQNAQQSTGPVTSAGKAAVRLNALKYGLRARDILIAGEDPAEYQRLWAALEAEWQPQTHTERLYLEQMATSQWLLARVTRGESQIYEAQIPIEKQFAFLREVSAQRTRLERSFNSGVRELKQLQKDRRAGRQPRTAQPAQSQPNAEAVPRPPVEPPAPPPDYRMSDAAEPVTPDSR